MPDTPDTCGRKPKLRIQEYSDTSERAEMNVSLSHLRTEEI